MNLPTDNLSIFKQINNITIFYNPIYDYFKKIYLGGKLIGTRVERSPKDLKTLVDNLDYIFYGSVSCNYSFPRYEFRDSREVVLLHLYPRVLYEYHIDRSWVKPFIKELKK